MTKLIRVGTEACGVVLSERRQCVGGNCCLLLLLSGAVKSWFLEKVGFRSLREDTEGP